MNHFLSSGFFNYVTADPREISKSHVKIQIKKILTKK
jgi:hypothetical protein